MNYDEAEKIIEQFGEIQEMAAPIAERMFELEHDRSINISPEEIIVDGGSLYAKTYEWHRCDDWKDEHEFYIPLEYLFDDDWAKQKELEREEQRKMKMALAIKKAEREAAEKKEREYAQYIELKKKFGDYPS